MVNLIDGGELRRRRRGRPRERARSAAAAGSRSRSSSTRSPPATPSSSSAPRTTRASTARLQAAVGDLSHICVPLFAGDRPVAALSVMSSSADERLGEEDRRTLELLSVALVGRPSAAPPSSRPSASQVEALARFEATFDGALDRDLMVRPRRPHPRREPRDPGAARLHRLEDCSADRVSEFVHPEDREPRARRLPGRERRRRLAAPRAALRPQGRRRDLGRLVGRRSCATSRASRSFAISMIEDVTQRKAAEEALRRAGRAQRAPGAARRAHRPAEPHAASATGSSTRSRAAPRTDGERRRAADGPRPLQGGQRLARPRTPATSCSSELGGRLQQRPARLGHGRPARRRRVRRAAAQARASRTT